MREGYASRTAEQNALFRTLESSLPESRRLFEDPLAHAFLAWPLTLVARLAVVPGLRQFVPWYIDHRWPGVRSSVVARTRLIDDAIATSLGEQTEQLVILGAGFDSRAYRLPGVRQVTVFEVDHPDTQASKRKILQHLRERRPARRRGDVVARRHVERTLCAVRELLLWLCVRRVERACRGPIAIRFGARGGD